MGKKRKLDYLKMDIKSYSIKQLPVNRLIFAFFVILLLSACLPEGMKEQANEKFGDQYFKTAIALVELHNIREGEYPSTLNKLKYLGDWDNVIFNAVEYKKLGDGYELNLVNGWMGKPEDLSLPEGYWNGLGLVKSNMKK